MRMISQASITYNSIIKELDVIYDHNKKAFVFEANATGINTAKSQQFFFESIKTMSNSKHSKKTYY